MMLGGKAAAARMYVIDVSIVIRRAILVVVLFSGLMVVTPSSVFGNQSVTLAWGPVTSSGLAGYNIYYGSVSHAYTNVMTAGNVTNATISGLVEGATYYFAVTTFSTAGLESTLSDEVPYTVPNVDPVGPLLQVTAGSTSYGTILSGLSATISFTVANVGNGTLSGTASVGLPFSIISGGSYSLGPSQRQVVTVIFSPLLTGNYVQSVIFTGGGGTNVTVGGSVTNGLVTTPIIHVTLGSISYGTISSGTSKMNSFMVQNVGNGTLSGTASVGAPFSIVSGGSYSLGAGQSQTVTVVFSPSTAGNYSQHVSFSGGGGTNTTVSGSVTNASSVIVAAPSPMIITKKVTASITNRVTLQFKTNLASPTWQTLGAFTGSTNVSFTNTPAVFFRGVCSNLTGSVTLTWPPSTDKLLLGYKVYFGTTSGANSSVINVGNVTTATISNLNGGTVYYFTIRTVSVLGLVSSYSSEVSAIPQTTSFSLTVDGR